VWGNVGYDLRGVGELVAREGGIRERKRKKRKRMDSKDLFQSLVFFNCHHVRILVHIISSAKTHKNNVSIMLNIKCTKLLKKEKV
jgi:hypothetical protein